MIQNQTMSGHTMSRFLSWLMTMPAHPQMVSRLSSPAMPFMTFQGPPTIMTPSTMPFIDVTWKSRMTASRMLSARIAAGNISAYLLRAMRG